MTAIVRVVVVDDSAAFAAACGELVAASDGFELVGTATSGEEAIDRMPELRPDLVLLDVSMPGIGGLEAAKRIRRSSPDTAVVLLTADSRLQVGPDDDSIALLSKRVLTRAKLRELWERASVGRRPLLSDRVGESAPRM